MTTLFNGINVVSISVRNLDEARHFYRDTLGLGAPLYDLPEAGWIEFSTGRETGNLSLVPAAPGWQPSTATMLVLDVEDCHAAVAELRRRGVTCDDVQVFPGFVTFASFYDPDGNRLQMCSPAPEAAADAEEDAADVAVYDARKAEDVSTLPAEVSMAIVRGESRLKALRKWRGLTQDRLAAEAGVTQGFLSDLEARRRAPSHDMLEKLAAVLDVPHSWIEG